MTTVVRHVSGHVHAWMSRMRRMMTINPTFVIVVTRFQMHRRLLRTAVTSVALVPVTTVCARLSTVARSRPRIHVGTTVTRPLLRGSHLLLHHDDLVLILDAAASVTVLRATRVILRASETLELYFYLMLRIAPVPASAATP